MTQSNAQPVWGQCVANEYVAHAERIGSLNLKIIADPDAENPRSWDEPASVMVCDHRRYTLGDESAHALAAEDIRASRDYRARWDEELDFGFGPDLYRAIQRCSDIVSLPLYLYDHSGITMSTAPFSCPWDSGQVGFIYMTKATALHQFMGGRRLTAQLRERVLGYLRTDVEVYDQYLTGDVWGYVIEDDDGEQVEDGALWSLFGLDYAIGEGRAAATRLTEAGPVPG